MSQQVFINFVVKDLKKSRVFYEALGYSFNPQFSNQDGACLIIDDGHIYAMLLTEAHFKKFTHKELVDAKITNEVLTALSLESREEVNVMHDKAIVAGGKLHREEDLGFMYTKAIEDLDGHVWEFFYMDMSKMPTGE
jgi:predicted lactoylglutathione lyase